MTPNINNNNNNVTNYFKTFCRLSWSNKNELHYSKQNKIKYINKYTATGNKINTRMQMEMSVTMTMVKKMQLVCLIWRINIRKVGPVAQSV